MSIKKRYPLADSVTDDNQSAPATLCKPTAKKIQQGGRLRVDNGKEEIKYPNLIPKQDDLDEDFLKLEGYKLKDKEPLGEGGCGKVFKVRSIETKETYAMKVIKIGRINNENRERVLREVAILSEYRHPFLATLTSYFFSEDGSTLYIVMKYYKYGKINM